MTPRQRFACAIPMFVAIAPLAIALLTIALLAIAPLAGAQPARAQSDSVRVWEEELVLPTYVAGDPEPNPMFYFGRASQGAEGRVYPYPLYDNLTNVQEDRPYKIVYLENDYIRVGIMPEIGGRIFEGYDKTNDHHFFYRQNVIKPALIGLIGAWISGGVEWNVPHHHRATTFLPVQYRIETAPDGTQTVWVGELEIRHRMRWAVGYTIRPDSSVLETKLRIVNRTPFEQTMLCFANAATHATEDYQIIFPPRTQHVTHHHKREFASWPIANSWYGGYNFSAGVDVSWYRNHIAANSMFAWNYEDQFLAGYDHGIQAGTMVVANPHIVPGKKFWTWGAGERGRMWDNILTDEDGPYIELMVGGFSDNQPDYSWLAPCEAKVFSMYWYPFRDIGGVKEANESAAVNLEIGDDGAAQVGFYATSPHAEAQARVVAGDAVLLNETIAIAPDRAFVREFAVPAGVAPTALRATLTVDGRELVAWSPLALEPEPTPEAVRAPEAPEDIATNEELYLTGLRIEQFHNPSLDPDPYWLEALRRDPADTRVNTALGVRYLKQARYDEAEALFRAVLGRLKPMHTMPRDADPLYYLAVTLKAQGQSDLAYELFYRATWDAAWRAAGYYGLAEIDSARGDWDTALDHLRQSLEANALNGRALHLRAAVLRHLGRERQALRAIERVERAVDPLDVRSLAERWLATGADADRQALTDEMAAHPDTAQETAAEFFNAGLWEDGERVMAALIGAAGVDQVSPMVHYYHSLFLARMGREQAALEAARRGAQASPEYVFPFQAEAIDVLRHIMALNPRDGRAPYYLGNLLYDWQPDAAIALWEQAIAIDPAMPIAHRNLAVAYGRRGDEGALEQAIARMEHAVAAPDKYALHFYELDALYQAAGVAPEKRLATLDENAAVVEKRDDALSRRIALQVLLGQYDDAIAGMTGRKFDVWEGGTLSVAEDWTNAHILRGRQRLADGQAAEALADFEAAGSLPPNLPTEGRRGGRQVELDWWQGKARQAMGDADQARAHWESAAGARASGDEQAYYRALAMEELGDGERAERTLRTLIEQARERLEGDEQVDFFASFTDRRWQRNRVADGHFQLGLAHLGLGERDQARAEFEAALAADPSHVGAHYERKSVNAK